MARRLAREEALFAGTSFGANVVAAINVVEQLGSGEKVVTPMVELGMKYLGTDVYRRGQGAASIPAGPNQKGRGASPAPVLRSRWHAMQPLESMPG